MFSQTLNYLTNALLIYWQSGFWTLHFAAAFATVLIYGKPSITALPAGLGWCVSTFLTVVLYDGITKPLFPFVPHSDLADDFTGITTFNCLVQWCRAFIGPLSVLYLFAGLIFFLFGYFLANINERWRPIIEAGFGDVDPLRTLYALLIILWFTGTVIVLVLRDAAKEAYMALEDKPFVTNIISTIVILVLLFAGFYIIEDRFKMVVWFLFLLIAYPVILAFTISLARGSAVFTDKSLADLYREGLTQVPFIGKLIGVGDKKPTPSDDPPKEP